MLHFGLEKGIRLYIFWCALVILIPSTHLITRVKPSQPYLCPRRAQHFPKVLKNGLLCSCKYSNTVRLGRKFVNVMLSARVVVLLCIAKILPLCHFLCKAGLAGRVAGLYLRSRSQVQRVIKMFTGIISDIGTITKLDQQGDLRVRIETSYDTAGIDIGTSIASDGVCLTVIAREGDWYDVQISAETISKTNLDRWQVGKRVNLERALKVGDELGGHIVSGHVDGVAEIVAIEDEGDSSRVTLRAPADLARFIAPKGSVALNGTSLTVNDVTGCEFEINFIPHTREVTTWEDVAVGDRVNLEIDTLSRYVARLAEMP